MGSARNGEDTSKIDAHAPELYVLTDGSHVISSQHGQLGRELGEKKARGACRRPSKWKLLEGVGLHGI